jgi:hypothetical protein
MQESLSRNNVLSLVANKSTMELLISTTSKKTLHFTYSSNCVAALKSLGIFTIGLDFLDVVNSFVSYSKTLAFLTEVKNFSDPILIIKSDMPRVPTDQGGGVPGMLSFLGDQTTEFPVFAPPFIRKDNVLLSQTANICMFLGTKYGLAPTDEVELAQANQLGMTIMDFVAEVKKFFYASLNLRHTTPIIL